MLHLSKTGRIDIVITYSDIKAKRDEVKASRNAYVQKIRSMAKKLMDAYLQSLQLPSEQWCDINGDKHPYAYIMDGGFMKRPEGLGVDLHKGASFELFTVTDDDLRDPQAEKVHVSINIIDDEVFEIAVTGYKAEVFTPVNSDEKIKEICEFIKDSVLMSINDVAFGARKNDNTIKLWG